MARVDLTVRGAGILGLSVAWEAVRRGARVRVIDIAGVGAGASGGLVGALAPHVPEAWNEKKAFQLDSLMMAGDWWGVVDTTSGQPSGYGRAGRLQPLADASAVSQARSRQCEAAALWRGQAAWQVIPVSGAAWEPHSPSGYLVRDDLTARLNPRAALGALVGAIRARGGEVIEGEAEDQGAVVWATGVAGLAALSQSMGRVVGNGVKGQALLIGHDARHASQIFVDGLHIVPHADGTTAIGSTSENRWDDPTSTDAQLDALHARAIAALPVLQDAPILERWAALRPRARSRAPVLGPWPDRPGHFIANGGFKIGFGMAPKMAECLVDLIFGIVDRIPAGFRPNVL
ncbi:MAG: NAD(P)/FAD-dependent oxidoreductase [Paracoccaceae bacterium]